MTVAAARNFDGDFVVVMNGGILKAYPEYAKAVQKKASLQARMLYSDMPPVYGGFVEALWDCGIIPSDGVRSRFMEDYRKLAKVKG